MLCSFLCLTIIGFFIYIPIFTCCVFPHHLFLLLLHAVFFLYFKHSWIFLHKISNSPFHLLLSFFFFFFLIAVLNVKDAFFTTAVFIAQMSAKRMSTEHIALASLVCLPLHPPLSCPPPAVFEVDVQYPAVVKPFSSHQGGSLSFEN